MSTPALRLARFLVLAASAVVAFACYYGLYLLLT